jgi:hypothetical protein
MRKIFKGLILLLVVSLGATIASADDYGKEMKKSLKSCFGTDYSKYQFLGSPVSNFGTGTMYPQTATQKDFDIKTAGLYGNPETWWAQSYTQVQIDALLLPLIPNGNAGAVKCNLNLTKNFSLDAILPSLYKVLTLSGKFDYKKSVQVQITADDVVYHPLEWDVLSDYIKDKKIKPSVLAHFDANDYLITIGDIVINKYSIKLVLAKNLSADAQAKLTSAWKQFGANSGLDASFSSGDNGDYSLTATAPVVAAVYVNSPPRGGVRDSKAPKTIPAVLSQKTIQDIQTTNQKQIKAE